MQIKTNATTVSGTTTMKKSLEIYAAVIDGRDGTAKIEFFQNADKLDRLIEIRDDFNLNIDGYETLTFPADFDLKKCGIEVSDDDYPED